MTKAEKNMVKCVSKAIVELDYQAIKHKGKKRKTLIAARNILTQEIFSSKAVEKIVKKYDFLIS